MDRPLTILRTTDLPARALSRKQRRHRTYQTRRDLMLKLGICINSSLAVTGRPRIARVEHGPPVTPGGKCQHCIDQHKRSRDNWMAQTPTGARLSKRMLVGLWWFADPSSGQRPHGNTLRGLAKHGLIAPIGRTRWVLADAGREFLAAEGTRIVDAAPANDIAHDFARAA